MKVNSAKSRRLMSGNKKAITNIDNKCITSEGALGLLGISIDSKQTFENHINKLYKKASQK